MNTNLTKNGAKWAVEVTGEPDEKVLTKTFSNRDAAVGWIRAVGQGETEVPALKKKGGTKPKSKKAAPKKKV